MLKKLKENWKLLLVFILGLLITIYPIISNYYYTIKNNNKIEAFDEATNEISKEEIDKRIDLARAYNETLDPSRLADPYTKRQERGLENYARMIEVKEQIGYIEIPKISQKIPVYAGTSEEVLQKAAGHLEGTSLPIGGQDTHSVITAHRGLPYVKLFRELNKLEKGDIFYFKNIKETLAYEVDQILNIEPWDFDPVLVVKGKDYMTLLTCTPYMINSHRLLVRGKRVPYEERPEDKKVDSHIEKNNGHNIWTRIIITAIIILFIIIIILYGKIKRRYEQKK